MPKVLIISPYFSPVNAADMHRIRTSLPYFDKFNWIAEVICVDEKYSDMIKDPLLSISVPEHIKIHKVKAFKKAFTSKIGLGSIALRSLYFYKIYVDKILKSNKFDLIYFSTTQFPVCILGPYWKKKFKTPYVIDMQDPWHTEYYQDKPKKERPKKYWFSYRLNKYLEVIAMKNVDGIISVSKSYIDELYQRYPNLLKIPTEVIPFGSHELDFKIAEHINTKESAKLSEGLLNLLYIGAVGAIMRESIQFLCASLKHLKINNYDLYKKLRFHFIGTSYAPLGEGKPSVMDLAIDYEVEDIITEQTDRIPYFASLKLLQRADTLLILGSDDEAYNPSKIFTYALAKRPVIGIMKSENLAFQTISKFTKGLVISYNEANSRGRFLDYLKLMVEKKKSGVISADPSSVINFAELLTKKQADLFNKVLNKRK